MKPLVLVLFALICNYRIGCDCGGRTGPNDCFDEPPTDAGMTVNPPDGGLLALDAGLPEDSGQPLDAGVFDAGPLVDAGFSPDAGSSVDAGTPFDAGAPDAGLQPSTITVDPIYPLHGANWMDYVVNAGGGRAWNRPDTACLGSEAGYFKCLHGGEYRQFQPPGFTSCAGLVPHDLLRAFQWVCDESTTPITFRSRGLLPGVGLRQLIKADGSGFAPNSVIITDSTATPLFQTAITVWWGNTFAPVPTSAAIPQRLLANTIYVAPSSATTSGLFIAGADKVALVTLGQTKLTYTGPSGNWCHNDGTYAATGGNPFGAFVVCIGGTSPTPSRFLWIEASLDANLGAAQGALEINSTSMSRFNRTTVIGYQVGNGFDLSGTPSNALLFSWCDAIGGSGPTYNYTGYYIPTASTSVTIANSLASNSLDGIQSLSPNLVVYESTLFNNVPGTSGLKIGGSHSTVVGNLSFANGFGLYLTCPGGCTALANSAFNNSADGVLVDQPQVTVVNQVVAGTSSGAGIDVQATGATTFRDIVSTFSPIGFRIGNLAGNAPMFNDRVSVGNNAKGCDDTGAKSNFTSKQCLRGGIPPDSSTADPTNSFIGITTSDGNQSPGFPTPTFSVTAMNWSYFDSPTRGWGANGSSTLFAAANHTQCGGATGTATCQLYDFQLTSTESTQLLVGTYGQAFSGFCPGSTLPSTATNVITDAIGNTFLRSAIEILDPWANPNGDYDGLCESGEGCVFTPNLGSFQGTGDPALTQPCLTDTGNGIGSSITIYTYPNLN